MQGKILKDINPSVVIIAVSAVLVVGLACAFAENYELSWFTIDGGGGTSSGGQYLLSGTIGQPDAAYSEGGPYELLGGFWPGGPLCFVDFKSYAIFAEWWLETGPGMPADLHKDANDIVDNFDLDAFVNEWLESCPYAWPLK